MSKKGMTILVIVLAVILLGSLAGALVTRYLYLENHVFVEGTAYPKDAKQLDLRGAGISIECYEELQQKLPQCDISWEVPFQGSLTDADSRELTVTSLTDADVEILDFFTELATVNAQDCRDYPQLLALQQRRPDCAVLYRVSVDGKDYPQDAREISVTGLSEEDAGKLSYLPQLESLHLVEPTASPETVLGLTEAMPQLTVTCEKQVMGQTVTSSDTELDLTGIPLSGTEELERDLKYFPNLEKVIVSDCGLDSETLAAARDRVRQEYKLVWTVQCGKLTARTDDTYFMPVKYRVYYFHDADAYNLRYCEDMICIDLGHMSIHDIEFVRYMPHLKYLILAHSTVLDISPISDCKELVFLELDWTGVRDYTPLLGCTALEDLNLGNTYGDAKPITQMTWLKNLWWTGRSAGFYAQLSQELPGTHKEFYAKYTVGNGWRELKNYYDMRDLLGMEYMK